jgi:hypothetical protein
MTRALRRPKSELTELHPLAQLVVDEMAARDAPPLHSSDYDALAYFQADQYDGAQGSAGFDNWGRSLPRPQQGPVSTGRAWYGK